MKKIDITKQSGYLFFYYHPMLRHMYLSGPMQMFQYLADNNMGMKPPFIDVIMKHRIRSLYKLITQDDI